MLINNCDDSEREGGIQGFEYPGKPNPTDTFKTHNPRTDGFVFDPNPLDSTIYDSSNGPNTDPTAITLGHLDNVPRALCCNPPNNNWDMGIFKDTQDGEKTSRRIHHINLQYLQPRAVFQRGWRFGKPGNQVRPAAEGAKSVAAAICAEVFVLIASRFDRAASRSKRRSRCGKAF